VIDGNKTIETTQADLDVVLAQFARLQAASVPVLHVVGNHCAAIERPALHRALGLAMDRHAAYSVREAGWRLVVLDGVDVSVLWPEGSANHAAARAWLDAHAGEPNALPWNGGLSDAQFAWLQQELAAAAAAHERVVVFCHLPALVAACEPRHVLYDHERLAALLRATPAVVAYLAGHYHPGGYARDGHVHHVTLEAILEAPAGSTAYGWMDVYPDRLVLRGHGTLTSRTLLAADAPAAQ
jgi:manganese-dependent ADP-ribose/CDP-alcohol diphosphatase